MIDVPVVPVVVRPCTVLDVGNETEGGGVTVGIVGTNADELVATLGITLIIGTAAAELTPRLPISIEPSGIPLRAVPPGVVGDVGDDAMLVEPEPHIPDVAMLPDIAVVADVADPTAIPPPS